MKTRIGSPSSAVILAGGPAIFAGLPLSAHPKAFLPIANYPLHAYMLKTLSSAGVKQVIFCVREGLGMAVTDRLAALPPAMTYRVEETNWGTGGSLRAVAHLLRDEAFWVLNGDLLLDIDLSPMLAAHHERAAVATAACLKVQEIPWWMERVETDAAQSIKTIHRLHPLQCKRSKLRPVGLYLLDMTVLDFIPPERYFDLKEQLFAALYETGLSTGTWEVPGYCRTITSLEDFWHANQDALLGLVGPPHGNPPAAAAAPANPSRVAPSARIIPPARIAPSTSIGEHTLILGLTAIGQQCRVGRNAIINDCVFLDQAVVGDEVYLDRCVISDGMVIEAGRSLREAVVYQGESGEPQEASLVVRALSQGGGAGMSGASTWRPSHGAFYRRVKRWLDIAFSSAVLILLAPFMVFLALAITLDSPGNVLFYSERCGYRGQPFTMYKFRTMAKNATELKRTLLAWNEVDGPMFKLSGDPRVTRVGRWLRDTNLDELHQLWNILKGDMSLVGPRPLSMEEMYYNPRWRDVRLSVLPGITGLWQVERHSGYKFSDWVRYDLEYVRHASLSLDHQIIWKTPYKMVTFFWEAYRNKSPNQPKTTRS